MSGSVARQWIEQNGKHLAEINDLIWEYAEVGLQETKSAKLLADELERAGFKVERGVADMPTAFTATFGSGSPKIGFLAEYDALPHLSQKAQPTREPLVADAPGHGCGHATYGTAVLGAVIALKAEMERDHLPGTIVFLGCPAEETLVGKVFMARAGLFSDLDCALTWHPGTLNSVSMSSSNAMNSAKFTFYGRTSHAAGDPQNGRSALDAVELMNIAVNYLREHVIEEARMHYVITKGGGEPNVVPAEAEVWYYVRAPRRQDVDEIFERVKKIAEGAAMMTETTWKYDLLAACYNMLPNEVLSDVLYDAMKEVGAPQWSAADLDFARELTKSFQPGMKEATARYVAKQTNPADPRPLEAKLMDTYLDDEIRPGIDKGEIGKGSTDVADCAWVTPTAQFNAATTAIGAPGHSWQIVAAGATPIAHKGMELAAKTLAIAGSRLLREPELITKARAEFKAATAGQPYKCAVPAEIMPPLNQLAKH